ncbi:MAG: hypothetical protein GF392_02990 [Candidatus Omnitrophica bacterium]|nr:hypothetical protein [Candidatus Omnitrophota bacterium]
MTGKKVYSEIVCAVRDGRLKEPFDEAAFRKACPGLGEGTYYCYLYKHRKNNPGGNQEFFRLEPPGKFHLLRPVREDQMI